MIDYEVLKRCERNFLEKVLTNDMCGSRHSSKYLFPDLNKYDKNFQLMDAQQSMTRLIFVSEVVSEYVYTLFKEFNLPCLKGETENIETDGDYCRKNLFEYIFIKDGLRYAATFEDEPPYSESLLVEKYQIAQIYCVSLTFFGDVNRGYAIPHNRKYTVNISFKEFLTSVIGLSKKQYRRLIDEFKAIYQKGIEIQGLNVRQNLNDNSMFNFKKKVYKNLLREFHPAETIGYCFRLGKPNNNYKQLPDNDGYLFFKFNLCSNFRVYANCLIGDKSFAVSFVTAEYLYDTLTSNDSIDYTPVVLDYVKSIEQLIREILTSANIKFDIDKASLKNLASILCKHYNSLFATDPFLIKNLEVIIKDFADYSRNSFIHRENIVNYELVSSIRKNAHFILFAIISNFETKNKCIKEEILGCVNFKFLDMANFAKMLRPGLDAVDIFTYEGKSYTVTTVKSMALTPLKDIQEVSFKDVITGEIIIFDRYNFPLSINNVDKGLSDELLGSASYKEEMGDEEPSTFFDRKLNKEISNFLKKHPNDNFKNIKVVCVYSQLSTNYGYLGKEKIRKYENADTVKVFEDGCQELKAVINNVAESYNLKNLCFTENFISTDGNDISPFTKCIVATGYYSDGTEYEFMGVVSAIETFEPRKI